MGWSTARTRVQTNVCERLNLNLGWRSKDLNRPCQRQEFNGPKAEV